MGFESRLGAQNLVLTEFMAVNASGQRDGDGDLSDWIEIYNPDTRAVSLAGWSLSNDPDQLTQWVFPPAEVPAGGFLVVFASGKDGRDSQGRLHTNFKLNRDGEYLALVRPDGKTVASEFAPTYPRQVADVAYGKTMVTSTEWLVRPETAGRLFLPDTDRLGRNWIRPDFVEAEGDWQPTTMGIGYDRSGGTPDPTEPIGALNDVTQPGDGIEPTSSNSPSNEGVENAIDNNSRTKYLNFDKLNAGLTLTPSVGLSVVTGIRFTSANDAPERDPTSYLLSGSNDGQDFVEVARGKVPDFTGRFVTVEVAFTNQQAYSQYRLVFPSVRNAPSAVAVQIAEIEFLGHVGQVPPTFSELMTTPVENRMYGRVTAAYLRIPFNLQALPPLDRLALRVWFDDGFVAYLNGVEVARANAPTYPVFNSRALTNRSHNLAVYAERFDLRPYASLIHPGTNWLAIQALNDRADSPDFLIQAQLDNTQVTPGDAAYFEAATPGQLNGPPLQGLVDEPIVRPTRGFYESPIDVVISCPNDGATLRYTTNGQAPTLTNGVPYARPIRLDRTTTLRAAACREDWHASRVVTHTYVFLKDVMAQDRAAALAAGLPSSWNGQAADYGLDPRVVGPAGQDNYGGKYALSLLADLQSLPTLSIVMDREDLFGSSRGIYSHPENHGSAWERPASVELLYPDQRAGFQADAGLRIQGGAFRRFDLSLKKSFRIVFRDQYGSAALRYPLFGSEAAAEFDNVVLRANSNDAWPYGGSSALYVRDAFAMETARAMGRIAPHTTFVHLYLNGFYWGLYNPVERPDAAFSATYFGGDKATWDALNQDSVPDGTADAWNRLLSLLSQDISNHAVFQRLQGNNPDGTPNPAYEDLLDVENMIDYLILNFYVGNTDWPGRNWWVGRNRDHGEGFKFYPWDTETALGFSGLSANVTGADSAVARPYAALRANAEFRLQFADRVYRHFFHDGALSVNPAKPQWDAAHPENNRPAARFYQLAEQVRGGIVGESARWGDQLRTTPFTRDEHWQRQRDSLLANYFPQRSALVLEQLRRANLYPPIDPPVMNQHGGNVPSGFALTMSTTQGTIYYTTNGSDPRRPVSGLPLDALTYSQPLVLRDLVTLKARVLSGQVWSALNEATFIVGTPLLAITELHYHPADPSATELTAGFADADEFEFVEFFNPGAVTYDLRGLRLTNGITFDFKNSAIPRLGPGQFLLLVKNEAAFEQRYGAQLPVAGEYAGQLSNSGESLGLVNSQGTTVMRLTYGTRNPWPRAADGDGPSLEVVDPLGDLSSSTNWLASAITGGSPGAWAPPIPIELFGIRTGEGQLRFQFLGKMGAGYTVYASETFPTEAWHIIQQGESQPQNQAVEIAIDLIPPFPARFFRVSIP